jgi:hypothetical protein
MDQLLIHSGIEEKFIAATFDQWKAQCKFKNISGKSQRQVQVHARRALRCNIVRTLIMEDFRGFAVRLAFGQGTNIALVLVAPNRPRPPLQKHTTPFFLRLRTVASWLLSFVIHTHLGLRRPLVHDRTCRFSYTQWLRADHALHALLGSNVFAMTRFFVSLMQVALFEPGQAE